ncbi:MAG: hypothetical protein ACK58T_06340, partial [Phycisphaerae bacterium]
MAFHLSAPLNGQADESKPMLAIRSPRPYQVFQRRGMVPALSHEHHPGGAVRGFAEITVRVDAPERTDG